MVTIQAIDTLINIYHDFLERDDILNHVIFHILYHHLKFFSYLIHKKERSMYFFLLGCGVILVLLSITMTRIKNADKQ